MLLKLNQELSKINVSIENNFKDPDFSDFIMLHSNNIIGHGWKWNNKKEIVGFCGLELPAMKGKLCWTKSKVTSEDFETYLKLFQFAISDNYFWYSLPTKSCAGNYCKPLTEFDVFINHLNLFISSKYDIDRFHELLD